MDAPWGAGGGGVHESNETAGVLHPVDVSAEPCFRFFTRCLRSAIYSTCAGALQMRCLLSSVVCPTCWVNFSALISVPLQGGVSHLIRDGTVKYSVSRLPWCSATSLKMFSLGSCPSSPFRKRDHGRSSILGSRDHRKKFAFPANALARFEP